MPESNEQHPTTPHHPEPPPIAAKSKEMDEPVMVRTLTDTVQPTTQKMTADIDADILTTAGQRKINFIWESTQAIIAIMVTASTLYVAGALALKEEGESAAFLLLSNVFFVVIATYIQRTNHQKIGGVKSGDSGR